MDDIENVENEEDDSDDSNQSGTDPSDEIRRMKERDSTVSMNLEQRRYDPYEPP